jgi:hypothetical protein
MAMEENKEIIERILRKSSQPRPSGKLGAQVLSAWKQEQAAKSAAAALPPLISKRTWILLSLGLIGLVYWVLSQGAGSVPQTKLGDYLSKLNFSVNLEAFQLSSVAIMSIVAFVVMIGLNILIMNGKIRTTQLSVF